MYVDSATFEAPAATRRHQRAEGRVRLAFRSRDGVSVLDRLYQEGCGKARLPRCFGGVPEAVLINTAGGLTGGDRFAVEVELGAGASLSLTTQACERIYRSLGDVAQVSAQAVLAAGARLDWLPQETILFDGGRLSRRLEVDLHENASFLGVETVLFGRAAMGETVRAGLFRDCWRIRRGGSLVFADDLRFEGDIASQIERPAILGGRLAMATLLLVAPDAEARLDPVRAVLGEAGGVSAWDGKLLVRIAAADGLVLRSHLIPALSVLMNGRPLPKVWQL